MFWQSNRLRTGYQRIGLKTVLEQCLLVLMQKQQKSCSDWRRMQDFKRALRLLEIDCDYGYCRVCKKAVSIRQLKLNPLTQYCRYCRS